MKRTNNSLGPRNNSGFLSPSDNTVRTLEKALAVIEYLSTLNDDIDLASLAIALKMPKTSLLRLLKTLNSHNYVQKDERSGRYSLGWGLIYLGHVASQTFNLVNFVHPFLERLALQSGETANHVFLQGNHLVYIDQVVSKNVIRGVPVVGTNLSWRCTAAGKVLLSFQTEEKLEEILGQVELKRQTEKTITEPQQLRREVIRIREQGFALDDEETEYGGRCVAAPFFNKKGDLAGAISILGPISRINSDTISYLSELVRDTAREISQALGHTKI
jgi:IclR family KDG regulon transcriptional repressor